MQASRPSGGERPSGDRDVARADRCKRLARPRGQGLILLQRNHRAGKPRQHSRALAGAAADIEHAIGACDPRRLQELR